MKQSNLLCPQRFVGRLEYQRNLVETGIFHNLSEEVHPEQSFPYAVMSVDAACERFHAVVQMNGAQVAEAYHVAELSPHTLVVFPQVVAGSERVARIDADAHAAFVVHLADDVRQMVEREAHVATLPRCVFDDGCYPARFVKRQVDAVGYAVEAFFVAYLPERAAGMEVEHRKSQLLAALHLFHKRVAALLDAFFCRMPQIDEIAVVGENVLWFKAALRAVFLECIDAFLRERRSEPLPLILCE